MFESFRNLIACIAASSVIGLGGAAVGARDVRDVGNDRDSGDDKWKEARVGLGSRLAPERGQPGRDLELLRSFHSAPRKEGESNHYFDLWEPGGLVAFSAAQGLTNNRALIIDSHGTERSSWKGMTYVFRPNRAVMRGSEDRGSGSARGRDAFPSYSIADVAQVMGPEAAAEIHNVVIAGCNERGSLRPSVIRLHFVNATNITYMTAGHLSYKPVFFEALSAHSADVRQFYGRPVDESDGRVRTEILRARAFGATRLGQYVAELYLPGASKPFRRQRAGRELLEPDYPRAITQAQTSFW